MTPTIELICGHRSIRHFTDEPISEAQREAIINSARATSSSSFLQCSSIIRITDKALREELVTLTGGQKHVAQAAEFWVFCADFNRHLQICPDAQLGLAEQLLLGVVDTAMMAQNALIAAESLGLGGVYIGGLRNNIEAVTKLLKLPQHVLPLFGLCLGWPADNPDLKPRLPASILVHENSYQPLDKGALAHLRPMANDAGAVEIGGFEHRGVLRHPDVLQNLAIPVGGMVILLLRQLLSDFQNQVGDPGQRFPRIGKLRQIVPGQRMAQVIEILDCQHYFFTSIRWPLRSMASMI